MTRTRLALALALAARRHARLRPAPRRHRQGQRQHHRRGRPGHTATSRPSTAASSVESQRAGRRSRNRQRQHPGGRRHPASRSLSTVNGGIRVGEQARGDRGAWKRSTAASSSTAAAASATASTRSTARSAWSTRTSAAASIRSTATSPSASVRTCSGGIHVEKPSNSWFCMRKPKPPRIVIGPNAQVDGALVFEREVVLYVHTTAKVGSISGAKAIAVQRQHAAGRSVSSERGPCPFVGGAGRRAFGIVLRIAGLPTRRPADATHLSCFRLLPARSRWPPATAARQRVARCPGDAALRGRPTRRATPSSRTSPPGDFAEHVRVLASDEFEGRAPGQPGRGQDRRLPRSRSSSASA